MESVCVCVYASVTIEKENKKLNEIDTEIDTSQQIYSS